MKKIYRATSLDYKKEKKKIKTEKKCKDNKI